MSDARSLSPLSAADYDAIAAAVMETARGRWFLSEYARRNRQTDTEMVLSAIARLERLCTVPVALPDLGPEFSETARTIAELRDDLDRGGASARLSARIQETTAGIIEAAESIQEIAWTLREGGAEPELCDRLDRRATEIYGATTVIEAGANQIEKVSDTVAMLDASLRAAADVAAEESHPAVTAAPAQPAMIDPTTDLGDIDVVDAGTKQRVPLNETGLHQQTQPYRRRSSTQVAEDDIAFADVGAPAESIVLPETASSARLELSYSEADLRAIASLPVEDRLHFFG
ncbi:conserved hypothetical protein [Bosea sp. 62]|uniref:hypothetical protein n=1 Tax=unclassified Bosea (in: a-proteobacteria) TaxID=2653178 RepID=UPI00125349DD|nr:MULTISPECIES: hypothetical protein [unclassified Bosea (in: a-proteobacteria)]CAD5290644.1 conserved hypothetical protein [Bosea sp. 7B]CAD5300051.1 conserved hypothetical protein [Bosea sp. 21B]CAD5300542.1 conserved hypothetical protein [Bosea sp. 46]VVT61835.1 conserved hypothetical protein [Bosea sp. EC-HK365B]VXB43104.1 conserved hypothetical protein [Bosea sp. 125]